MNSSTNINFDSRVDISTKWKLLTAACYISCLAVLVACTSDSKPIEGDIELAPESRPNELGSSEDCRVAVLQNIDAYRAKRFTADEVIESLSKSCVSSNAGSLGQDNVVHKYIPPEDLMKTKYLEPHAAKQMVYKCENADGHVMYSSHGCDANIDQLGVQTIVKSSLSNSAAQSNREANIDPLYLGQLDALIRKAIANGDMQQARRLAQTAKHWEWITEAQRNVQPQPVSQAVGRSAVDFRAEKSRTLACKQAIRSFELESNSSSGRAAAIAAKRHIMNEACGILDVSGGIRIENTISNKQEIINTR